MQVGDVTVTYRELLQRVERLTAHLVQEGLEAGDRIALLCKNDLAFCELMMAVSRTGGDTTAGGTLSDSLTRDVNRAGS
jgi:acyl-coenzyme A synthetase/AMP-(fatty) acid ligase